MPEGEPKYASFKAKWDDDYRERWGIHSTFPEDLPERVAKEIDSVARRTFRVMRLRDHAPRDELARRAAEAYVASGAVTEAEAKYIDGEIKVAGEELNEFRKKLALAAQKKLKG